MILVCRFPLKYCNWDNSGVYSSLNLGFGHCNKNLHAPHCLITTSPQSLFILVFPTCLQQTSDVLLGFGRCFAGSVGYDKGNAGVDEEALTGMSDEIKASSEKWKNDKHVNVGYLYIPNTLCYPRIRACLHVAKPMLAHTCGMGVWSDQIPCHGHRHGGIFTRTRGHGKIWRPSRLFHC